MKLCGKIVTNISVLCGVALAGASCGWISDAGYKVEGYVTDGRGEPIEGISVSLEGGRNGKNVESVTLTDEDGEYVLWGITHSSRTVEVVARDIDGSRRGGEFATEKEYIRILEDEDRQQKVINFTLHLID